jgi:hypothetical protein
MSSPASTGSSKSRFLKSSRANGDVLYVDEEGRMGHKQPPTGWFEVIHFPKGGSRATALDPMPATRC